MGKVNPPCTKGKKRKKNEGSVMRAEVKRYKDREKAMLDDGSIPSKKRLSIHGLYSHGCTSGNVERDFGLDKEIQARAEANLSQILELANNANENSHNKKSSLVSLHISSVSVDGGLKNVSEVTIDSQKEKSKEANTDLYKMTTDDDDVQKVILERLATAACSGITSKLKHLRNSKKHLRSVMKQLNDMLKEGERNNMCGVTRKMSSLIKPKQVRQEERVGVSENCDSLTIVDTMKTPTSSEILEAELEIKIDNAPEIVLKTSLLNDSQHYSGTEVKNNSQSVITQIDAHHLTCPGTTIISPRSLLVHYEKKLDISKCSQREANPELCNSDLLDPCESDRKCIENEEKSKAFRSNQHINERKGNCSFDSRSCQRKCPKTVVINPLDYLERYEKKGEDSHLKSVKPILNSVGNRTNNCEFIVPSGNVNLYTNTNQSSLSCTSSDIIKTYGDDIPRTKDLLLHERQQNESDQSTGLLEIYNLQTNVKGLEKLEFSHDAESSTCQSDSTQSYKSLSALHPGNGVEYRSGQAECCFETKTTTSKKDNSSLHQSISSIPSVCQSFCHGVNTLEEELIKDYVFPRYVQKIPDKAKYDKSSGRSRDCQCIRSHGHNSCSDAVHSSSQSNTSSSNSQSSSQDIPVILPSFHHGRTQSLDINTKEQIMSYQDNSSLLKCDLKQQYQMEECSCVDDQHRFYRRKLY